jgi:hypothetical protein
MIALFHTSIYATEQPIGELTMPIQGWLDDPSLAETFVDPRDLLVPIIESYIPPPGAFTPDGSATVVDNFLEGTKEFFTFTTPSGNIFYLVVDRLREQHNVYFLNAVTEMDLMALAQQGDGRSGNVSAIPQVPQNNNEQTQQQPPAPNETTTPQETPAPTSNNSNTSIFILIAVALVGIAGYYFKIVKPKSKAAVADSDEDYEDYEEDNNDRNHNSSRNSGSKNNQKRRNHDEDDGYDDFDDYGDYDDD